MSQDHITEQDFFKSLGRLEALAKGESEEDNDLNKSQISTGSGSEPQSWAGGDKSSLGDNWDDDIQEDGTDYNRRSKKMRKGIMEKVAKGIPLSPNEVQLLKSDMDKAGPASMMEEEEEEGPRGKKHEDEDEEQDKELYEKMMAGKMGKSFAGAVQQNETVQQGVEVSDFLAELAKSFGIGLEGLEARVTHNVTNTVLNALGEFAGQQGEFNKSLADAVVNIGHGLSGAISHAEAQGQAPASAPRSQLRSIPGGNGMQVLNKGLGAGGADPQDPLGHLSKSQRLDRMVDLVEKGQISPLEVTKYETTGELSPAAAQTLIKSIGAGQ